MTLVSDTQALGTDLIAHAPDAIIFADCAGVIRLWNRAAEAMFGHGAAEAIGQTLDLIVPEPYRVAHWAGFSRAVERGRFARSDVLLTSRALTKDGRIIMVELAAAIVRSPLARFKASWQSDETLPSGPFVSAETRSLLLPRASRPHEPVEHSRPTRPAPARSSRILDVLHAVQRTRSPCTARTGDTGCFNGLATLLVLAMCAPLVTPSPGIAQNNFEIQVYGSETVAPGSTMVELDSNVAAEGSTKTTDHLLRTQGAFHETLEVTQGWTAWFETGFYVFTSIQPDTTWEWVGDHIRPRVFARATVHILRQVACQLVLTISGRNGLRTCCRRATRGDTLEARGS
jgi:PAS domain S-box-containing protein